MSSISASPRGDLVRVLVELEVVEPQAPGLRLRVPGAAQDHPDARDELLEAERLGHVVVTAAGQAAQLVLGRVARRQEDDRHLGAAGAELARDLEALHVGEHHVEHHQIRAERVDGRERVVPVDGRRDREALEAQRHRDDVDDVRLVVDDEHAAGFEGLGHGLPACGRTLGVS